MENEKNEKNEQLYVCINCDYKCLYLSDWNRHLNTRKHIISQNGNDLEINGTKFIEKNNSEIYSCEICKKEYKSFSGLWKHKKKCTETIVFDPSYNEIKTFVLYQNGEKSIQDVVIVNPKEEISIIILL